MCIVAVAIAVPVGMNKKVLFFILEDQFTKCLVVRQQRLMSEAMLEKNHIFVHLIFRGKIYRLSLSQNPILRMRLRQINNKTQIESEK